jgi:uncharacterized membrane protein YkvA (DUF1232 family)
MTDDSAQPPVMSFYSSLQTRVKAWLASDEAVSFPHAELYRHLPDLYRFLVEMALDSRVPERDRACTLSVVKYIVAPYDLIPEAIVGTSGFRDDLVLAAMMTEGLCIACDPALAVEHWAAVGQPRQIARTILEAATAVTGAEICERLRTWLPS